LEKVLINLDAIHADLERNWSVVAEAIQTVLRCENYPNPYEALLNLTRTNTRIDKNAIHKFIDSLNVNDELKERLKQISPQNYTGI
jgi:adenylosuccinate lyase